MTEVRRRWDDGETAADKVKRKRLEWLGHLAWMTDPRLPKSTLFGPQGGLRRQWRDLVKKDLKAAGIQENSWYEEALHRKK